MIHGPNGQLLSTLKSSHARRVNLGGHDEIYQKNRAAVCRKIWRGMMRWFWKLSETSYREDWRLGLPTHVCKSVFFPVDKLREQHLSTCLVCWVCQAQNVENQSIYLLNWAGNILGCCSAPSRNARPRQVLQLQRHLPDNRHIFFSVSGIGFYSLQPWLGLRVRKLARTCPCPAIFGLRRWRMETWHQRHVVIHHWDLSLLEGPKPESSNVWVMSCHRHPIDRIDPNIVERNCRSADLALMAQASGSWCVLGGSVLDEVPECVLSLTEDSTWSSKAKWNMWAE